MNITSNRGMYAEAMINRTIAYYHSKKIALIEKRYCPFQLTKNLANNSFIGRLLSKSGADYYGIYQGKHLEFEVKQVQEESFNLANIAKHQ